MSAGCRPGGHAAHSGDGCGHRNANVEIEFFGCGGSQKGLSLALCSHAAALYPPGEVVGEAPPNDEPAYRQDEVEFGANALAAVEGRLHSAMVFNLLRAQLSCPGGGRLPAPVPARPRSAMLVVWERWFASSSILHPSNHVSPIVGCLVAHYIATFHRALVPLNGVQFCGSGLTLLARLHEKEEGDGMRGRTEGI